MIHICKPDEGYSDQHVKKRSGCSQIVCGSFSLQDHEIQVWGHIAGVTTRIRGLWHNNKHTHLTSLQYMLPVINSWTHDGGSWWVSSYWCCIYNVLWFSGSGEITWLKCEWHASHPAGSFFWWVKSILELAIWHLSQFREFHPPRCSQRSMWNTGA